MKFDYERRMPLAKPCPFCGSRNVVTERKEHFDASEYKTCTFVRCVNCGVQIVGMPVLNDEGKFVEDYETAQRQALKLWNRRVSA